MAHIEHSSPVMTNDDKAHPIVEEDDRSSLSSYEAHAGVKGIEAISSTWSKWALIFAYIGYVERHLVLRYVLS